MIKKKIPISFTVLRKIILVSPQPKNLAFGFCWRARDNAGKEVGKLLGIIILETYSNSNTRLTQESSLA